MKRWYLFSGILAALLGLLVIIFPSFWIKLVVVIIGLAAIAYGIYCLKFTKALSDDIYYRRTILIKSIVSIIAGVMAVLFPLAIGGAAWTAMIWVLIIYLLASAAIGFYAAALLKDSGVERKRYIIENLLQSCYLFIRNSSSILWIYTVGSHFNSIDSKNIRPRCP